MRLKNRRYGRTTDSITASSSTHIIKIGFDARNPGDTYPRPGKYNGFVICRDRIGPDNNLIVDHAIMQRLDPTWSSAKLVQAQREQLNAADDLLPHTLHFVLLRDAEKDSDGAWQYRGTFDEALEWWGKSGLMCIGNGESALRRQDNGTRKQMECVPYGRADIDDPSHFCPHSTPRIVKDRRGNDQKVVDCKSHARLTLCLYLLGPDGKPQPLCRELGWKAKYRFDTSSGYSPLGILEALDAASNRLDGKIHWITGALTFAKQRKRHEAGVGIVQEVMFSLSEEDIIHREGELRRQRMEEKGHLLEEAPEPKRITAEFPTPTVDPDEELHVAAAAAEASESPWPDPSEVYDEGDGIEYVDPTVQQASSDDYTGVAAGETYPEPEAIDLTIETAPPKLLADSLDAFIRQIAREEGNPLGEVWRRMAVIELPDGRRGAPQKPQSFLEHSPEWPGERRIDDLRALCREFADNDPRFQLIQSPEPVAAG